MTTIRIMDEYEVHAYKGYFVGSYCVASGDGRFVGRAQICTHRPSSQARAKPVEQVQSVGAYPDAARALKAAQHQARQVIDSLTPNWDPFTNPGWLVSR
jgi:hypothetical protein